VVDDVRADALDAAAPEIAYFPLLATEGEPGWSLDLGFSFVVRSRRGDPVGLDAAVRAAAASLDPTAVVANFRPLQHVVDRSMVRTSFTLMLLGIAAAIALLLGAVGIYGVISYVVGQRGAEIGVRMALGARASQVCGLVLGQSLRLAAAGVAAGLVGALALTRSLRALLFDVGASDPVVLGAVSATLMAVALLAAAVPAARAARVDPMRTLRGD
jgi:ABC-type antimicrobial peptide transport system permease subunit